MKRVCVIGAGLAGSEAAMQLARRGIGVVLVEARPFLRNPVHKTENFAELVCSNSLKSTDENTAAGLLKHELSVLDSFLLGLAYQHRVPAGGALAVDRLAFSRDATLALGKHPLVECLADEALSIGENGTVHLARHGQTAPFDAIVLATGPLTSEPLSSWLLEQTGEEGLAFYDAAAPIVFAHSLDRAKVFAQDRYSEKPGDYLNAPFTRDEYELFVDELIKADRVIARDFENKDLFQACQPIEELARNGRDAPRFGPLKPVGLTDPRTGKRPWAVVQLRAEDLHAQSYNLVGFQTNLSFPEQQRVFRMIPGLENAEFARFGVMHRNTFLNAPRLMTPRQAFRPTATEEHPVFLAGQLSGTEGYCEAIRSGLQAAIEVFLHINALECPTPPKDTVYGALLCYATSESTKDYQPMHVNFGLLDPLDTHIRSKSDRKAAYALRAKSAMDAYAALLKEAGA